MGMNIWHVHDWNEWKVVERCEIAARDEAETPTPKRIGNYLLQERTCKTCGFTQMDRQVARL